MDNTFSDCLREKIKARTASAPNKEGLPSIVSDCLMEDEMKMEAAQARRKLNRVLVGAVWLLYGIQKDQYLHE
jgi:hypothetical protein